MSVKITKAQALSSHSNKIIAQWIRQGACGNSTGSTGFINLNIGHHRDSNLEFSFLVNSILITSSWILLNNPQTTDDVFHNLRLLTNIRQVDKFLGIHCKAGSATTNLVRDLPGNGVSWLHLHGIVYILSLSKVIANNNVMFDSKRGNKFVLKDSFG